MSISSKNYKWGSFEVWADDDSFIGLFYSINARESVSVAAHKGGSSVYRLSSGILLVRREDSPSESDGVIVTAGDAISLDENTPYIFSAIRDCEVYGIAPRAPGEKVGKKTGDL